MIDYCVFTRMPNHMHITRYYVMVFDYMAASRVTGYHDYIGHPAASAVKKFYTKREAVGYAKYLNRTHIKDRKNPMIGVKIVEQHF